MRCFLFQNLLFNPKELQGTTDLHKGLRNVWYSLLQSSTQLLCFTNFGNVVSLPVLRWLVTALPVPCSPLHSQQERRQEPDTAAFSTAL